MEFAQILLVVFHHVFDVGLVVGRAREGLHLAHERFVFLGDFGRDFYPELLGYGPHLLVQLGVIVNHFPGKLLDLVVVAFLQGEFAQLHLCDAALHGFLDENFIDGGLLVCLHAAHVAQLVGRVRNRRRPGRRVDGRSLSLAIGG